MVINRESENFNGKDLLTLKSLIAMTVADIDICLLQNEDTTADTEKQFTKEEVTEQLEKTMHNVCSALIKTGFDIDEPLITKLFVTEIS